MFITFRADREQNCEEIKPSTSNWFALVAVILSIICYIVVYQLIY